MPLPTKLTIKNAWICQVQNRTIRPIFANLVIEKGKIVSIQPENSEIFSFKPTTPSGKVFDAGGRVVTVPMVNFHEHIYSRLAKGLPVTGSMDNFLNILKNLWWKLDCNLDLKMIRSSAKLTALESLRSGVGYIFDHHSSPYCTPGSLSEISGILQEAGLRGVLSFETSDRNGAPFAENALRENENFARNGVNENIKAMIGLHAPFTLSDETLRRAAELLQELGTGIHIHLGEGKIEYQFSMEKYGLPPARRLKSFRLLDPKSILAHGIHLPGEDYQLISDSGAAIACNPDSNLNNKVGLPEYASLPLAIPILAGTDGMHTNIAHALKQLFLFYRYQGGEFADAFDWIRKVYFDQLNFVKQYFPDFSSLVPGNRADLIIWDYCPPTPFTAENFWGHYVYGILESPVNSLIQGGRFLMRNHEILSIDEETIYREAGGQGKRLFEKMKKTE